MGLNAINHYSSVIITSTLEKSNQKLLVTWKHVFSERNRLVLPNLFILLSQICQSFENLILR